MSPTLISGASHKDSRGFLNYNNGFDASKVKRIYTIENLDRNIIRAWQGHKIEQRWFSVMTGKFLIKLIQIDDWLNPNPDLDINSFILTSEKLDVLHVPSGFVNSIQALEDNSKLLVMSDYFLDEVDDNYKYDPDYFEM